MTNSKGHYYIANGVKYDNMKALCEGLPGMKSTLLGRLLRWGLIEKVEI